ncbi:MAG: hypothetical protein CM1200mP26_30340 [Acidimicrobiales bacterium]|nr:MAG: hypothetical protein CM1200mP26_30340 [Acidimicrobiales bacterium]
MSRRSDAIERFTVEAEASGLEVEGAAVSRGTRTAADAAEAVGCPVDQIVKSLVFMADVPGPGAGSRVRAVAELTRNAWRPTWVLRSALPEQVRSGRQTRGLPLAELLHWAPPCPATLVDPHLMDFDRSGRRPVHPIPCFPVKPKGSG